MRDIRQNKMDRPRKLLSIQQCPDCELYDRQIVVLQPGQQYQVLSKSNECPNCKSKNFAAVVTEDEVEPFNDNNIVGGEKKQGKYRHIRIEGKPYSDGSGCRCPPFKDELELKAEQQEKRIGNPRCLSRYVLTAKKNII